MKYKIETWTISKLVDGYKKNLIELNPPYQRNDIWSLPAKKRLIDTILKGYPLPTFFFHRLANGMYNVVDGQQRIRTILGFFNGMFATLDNKKFGDINESFFMDNYDLPIIIIEEVHSEKDESMEEFYYRVNMFGSKLNRPEILKSKYFNSPLQNLIERLTDSDDFKSLNLFTESTLNRMIDYDFLGELISLLKEGITDKKIAVDRLYEDESFTEEIAKDYEAKFHGILQIFLGFNSIYPIKETRYKQRNDFYTLFDFINKYNHLNRNVLNYFYKILVLIGNDIYPTNDECFALQNYAFNCVSQSNSKNARESRLKFLTDLLLNREPNPFLKNDNEGYSENFIDVLKYYKLHDEDLIEINGFYLINDKRLQQNKSEIKFYSE